MGSRCRLLAQPTGVEDKYQLNWDRFGVERGPCFDAVLDFGLKGSLAPILDYDGLDFSAALKEPDIVRIVRGVPLTGDGIVGRVDSRIR